MTIKIVAFGQISDIISQTEMEFSSLKNTNELRIELIKQFPKLAHIKYAIAVNDKIVDQETRINDQDVIVLLPPFSGG